MDLGARGHGTAHRRKPSVAPRCGAQAAPDYKEGHRRHREPRLQHGDRGDDGVREPRQGAGSREPAGGGAAAYHARAVRPAPGRGAVVVARTRGVDLHRDLALVRRATRRSGRRGSSGAGERKGPRARDGEPRGERGGGRRPGDAGRVRAEVRGREAGEEDDLRAGSAVELRGLEDACYDVAKQVNDPRENQLRHPSWTDSAWPHPIVSSPRPSSSSARCESRITSAAILRAMPPSMPFVWYTSASSSSSTSGMIRISSFSMAISWSYTSCSLFAAR